MDWKDVGKLIGKAAPVLGAVLSGPAGLIVSAAGALVSSKLGCESTPEAVSSVLAASPEALVKIRQIEADERARLLDYQTMQTQFDLENLKSARLRESEVAKTGSWISWATTIVSIVITLGFFAMLVVVLKTGSEEIGEAGVLLLGSLSSAFGAVVQYYLGSSLGSAKKEQYLNAGAKK